MFEAAPLGFEPTQGGLPRLNTLKLVPFGRVPYYCRLGLYYRNADSILEASQTPSQWTGLLRELSPGPLAPEARIMPLDQAAIDNCGTTLV